MTGIHYRNRKGEQITLEAWSAHFEDWSYRCVRDEVTRGVRVVTIWDGLDKYGAAHRSIDFPIFATAAFTEGGAMIHEIETFTEAQALATHERFVQLAALGLGAVPQAASLFARWGTVSFDYLDDLGE